MCINKGEGGERENKNTAWRRYDKENKKTFDSVLGGLEEEGRSTKTARKATKIALSP